MNNLSKPNDRYARQWPIDFIKGYSQFLQPGVRVLDVGSGTTPAISRKYRPEDTLYVGLDVSESELMKAPEGAYSETVCSDLRQLTPELVGRFDLVVSKQVLEHVKPLGPAVKNVHQYLVEGGHFVSILSGRNAFFSVANRMIPGSWAKVIMERLLNRKPETVFTAYYDQCTHSGLKSVFEDWSSVEVIPIFRGAGYLGFSKILARAYLVYENWAARTNKRDLATHYVVIARK
jgi:SAM-dependent methyltransferase